MSNTKNKLIHVVDENEGILYNIDHPYGVSFLMINENEKKNNKDYYCLSNIFCCSLLIFTFISSITFFYFLEDLTFDKLEFNTTNVTNVTNIK